MKQNQSGRSLLETISVLVIMALLIVAGIVGYNFAIRKYRENETVKQVSELAVRYKLKPIKAEDKFVKIKDVYPEAERADAMNIRTADTSAGRISLQVFDETAASSFAVVVNSVLDDSCRAILKEAEYDVAIFGDDIDAKTAVKKNAYSRDYLLNDPEGQKIAQELCKAINSQHNMKKMGLIMGDHCPSVGASYWYNGRCWNCASDREQDMYGNCCARGQVDACGVCPGKCPNGGVCDPTKKICVECISDDECAGRSDGKLKCNLSTNTCVECLNVGGLCEGTGPGSGKVSKFCMKNHTCQECDTTKHMRWNKELDICECAEPLIAKGETCYGGCCVDGTRCHEGICKGCWFDYDPLDPTKEGSCYPERPLCQEGTCQGCPAVPTAEGDTCLALCGCDASKGLACGADETCACTVNPTRSIWVAAKGLCCPSNSNYGDICDAETGTTCCSTGYCTAAGDDGTRLCCNEGEINSSGHCCPSGTEWEEASGHCCATGKTWKAGKTEEKGVCCATSEVNADGAGHCCPADKPHWKDGVGCIQCVSNNECPVHEFCNTSGSKYECEPCTGVTGGNAEYLQHTPDTTDRCECTGGFRLWCGSTKTSVSCLFGRTASVTCKGGCTQHPDCDENYYCSCLGTGCPAAGGECKPCPSDKPLRPKDSPEDCRPGGDTCDPANCEKFVEGVGCVSICTEGQACVSYKDGTNTCGASQCVNVLPKDELIRKVGTINNKTFYIPPAESKYRMTHASADRFCAHYGMHLARVMEACLKDFKYDSGHDCPNFAAYNATTKTYIYTFTDRGQTYNLQSWNTSSSGDFWLAERDGNNALRVTHSCGNNHETNVCENIYPLCTE